QTGLTFSGLTQETNYFIFARSAANTNYNAGTPSVALPATTAAPPPEYVITGSDTTFTATRGGVTITGADGVTIQNAINAIRTNAAGNDCTIQFGDGTTAIITPAASDFSGSSWGNIILTGKLTSQSFAITINNNIGPGTITIDSAAEITSNIIVIDNVSSRSIIVNGGRLEATSDSSAIRNQSNGSVTIEGGIVSSVNGNVITNISTGTITINGGRLETTGNDAIWNILSGSVTINGGTVSAVNGNAITNSSTGTVTITGGRVEATGTNSRAIDSTGAGLITISGDVWDNEAGTGTLVTSANAAATDANRGTIHVANIASNTAERLRITGGTVSNTSTGAAIWNLSGGTINISGGMVQAATGNAIFSNNGLITITGDLWEGTNKTGTLITSANPGNTASVIAAATGGTIRIMGVDVNHIGLTITGGTVSNTAADGGVTSNGIAVFQSRGRMNIIDGRVEAANGSAIRFGGGGAGEVSISGDSTVVIGGGITIIIDSDGGIRDGVASILGGKVETTNPGVPVIQAINFTQTHIVLGGNPEITGGTGIQVAGAGATNRIRVSSSFAPSADRTYVLNPNGTPTPGTGRVAVQDGAPHFARFARHSSVTATLAVSGNNIIWQ
ncbi:MAG: hypothetical protein FWD36_06090, partial [Treponema sp.]|nr:hypothetical protein [Treponema sp.]